MKARDIIFTALIGFLIAWSALSAFALLQAMLGFTDTYAETSPNIRTWRRAKQGKQP